MITLFTLIFKCKDNLHCTTINADGSRHRPFQPRISCCMFFFISALSVFFHLYPEEQFHLVINLAKPTSHQPDFDASSLSRVVSRVVYPFIDFTVFDPLTVSTEEETFLGSNRRPVRYSKRPNGHSESL